MSETVIDGAEIVTVFAGHDLDSAGQSA